jgi:outer membrane protein
VQGALADVAQTYFTHLRNVHRIAVLDANVERARQLLELASNQFSVGVATQIDVTRARSLLAQAQQARLQQDTVVYQSDLLLKRLLNLEGGKPVQLADFTVRRVAGSDFSAAEEHAAFAQRPDWLSAQKSLDRTKLDVRTASFERLPVLALSGQYGYSAAEFDDGGKKAGWFAGAIVSVPVFDGLRSTSDRRLALSRQRAGEFRLRDLELQISAEIRLAVQNAASRFRQIDVAETGLRLGEEELRLARVRFEQGVADNREVIEAQNTLALASDNFNEAIYQYNLSRVELARAKGEVRGILAEKQE